jgi:murein L,D-transpeptidase YafK
VGKKNTSDQEFLHIKTYTVCATSGLIGPKRMQGDLQIPEGFYYIDRFNPYSNFYLSLGINYPNTSDRILGDKNNLGGDIFIHGDCVTIGCLPITDSEIKELYIFCVEAKTMDN